MESMTLPTRLLSYDDDGKFYVFETSKDKSGLVKQGQKHFDILSYIWGEKVPKYDHGNEGVGWHVKVHPDKLTEIKTLMMEIQMQYMWVDCVCINRDDRSDQAREIPRMYEYYRMATRCHIMLHMDEVWDPNEIVDDLEFLDYVMSYTRGTALASETLRTQTLKQQLSTWAHSDWVFPLDQATVRPAAIEMGVLNCYATCIHRIRSLFDNLYFTRVWTFQEMLLGKNITMWGISNKGESISSIGELNTWMDLATDARDKASKLVKWVLESRHEHSTSVSTIVRIIAEDHFSLRRLQAQVRGISSARADIINGGPRWWHDNHKSISNVFSAISIRPREASFKADVFVGLLGVFHGMFTEEEIEELTKENEETKEVDIEAISFAFFKRLSIKTKHAWTRLAISSHERGQWGWIPVVANHDRLLTTDIFTGVFNLGRLKTPQLASTAQKGVARATAVTGLSGYPRRYATIQINEHKEKSFRFKFMGCNCGKSIKTKLFRSERIPKNEECMNVFGDETGRTLVQCVIILGSLLDPDGGVVDYRTRLLENLQPVWRVTDENAKPDEWINRCVSGTSWEKPDPQYFRVHSLSVNLMMKDMIDCRSRLQNETTANISCEITLNCGCVVVAPFSMAIAAIPASKGSFLGDASVALDPDDRIKLSDGLGLVQVGDVDKTFQLMAFGGRVDTHKAHAASCRSTAVDKPVPLKESWPMGRALVREDFRHDRVADAMRDYGYVRTGGSGNLLICRGHPLDKIVGVCIDEDIAHTKGERLVDIR